MIAKEEMKEEMKGTEGCLIGGEGYDKTRNKIYV